MAKDDKEENPEEGGKSKKMLIIIIAAVVLLVGAGVGAFLFMGGEDEEPKLSPEEEQAELEKQAKQVGPMVTIETFIVNIMDDQESRYLKASITLEVDNEMTTMEINERMPQLKDAVLLLLGNKSFSELNDLQGKIQLRAELINKVNSLLVKGKIKRIYFTEFVVQ